MYGKHHRSRHCQSKRILGSCIAAATIAACSNGDLAVTSSGTTETASAIPNAAESASLPAPPDVVAPPVEAERSSSGLASKVIKPGKGGDHPGPEDMIEANYTGWTTDGRMFDSSMLRNRPGRFRLNQVIKGWTEGLRLMSVGETRRLWIPAELAFNNVPGRPAGMVVFDVELLSFTPSKLPAPPDVAMPPKEAKRMASGLAYMIMRKSTGTRRAQPIDCVEVHYTGWTTDGNMFDSSVVRRQASVFALPRLIRGWAEGVRLMAEGETARFWIPPSSRTVTSSDARRARLSSTSSSCVSSRASNSPCR